MALAATPARVSPPQARPPLVGARALRGVASPLAAVELLPSPVQPVLLPCPWPWSLCVRKRREEEDDGSLINLVRVNYSMV
jgi:hypothetical protein